MAFSIFLTDATNSLNPFAVIDDGSCIVPVDGCTDPNAINYNPFATPDEEIKVVASLGSNYYVWDLGSKNFLTGVDESMASTPNTRGEYTLSYSNRRHDFVPYINSSILTLTQTGTY